LTRSRAGFESIGGLISTAKRRGSFAGLLRRFPLQGNALLQESRLASQQNLSRHTAHFNRS
jgi:hypothetical protein